MTDDGVSAGIAGGVDDGVTARAEDGVRDGVIDGATDGVIAAAEAVGVGRRGMDTPGRPDAGVGRDDAAGRGNRTVASDAASFAALATAFARGVAFSTSRRRRCDSSH